MTRAAIATLALVLAAPSTARADEAVAPSERPDSRFDGVVGVENRRYGDPAAIGADSIWSGLMSVRGLGQDHVAGGVDLALGGGPGTYYVARVVVGAGVRLPGNGRIVLGTGVGVSGLTGDRIGFGVDIPLELEATVALGSRVRPTLMVRPSLVLAEDARQRGTRFAVIDELDATLALTVISSQRGLTASGLYLGASYGERLGGRELGLVLGYAVDTLESPASRERERLAKAEAARKKREREAEAAERRRVADAAAHERFLADQAAQAERTRYAAEHPQPPGTPSGWTTPAPPVDRTPATIGLIDGEHGFQIVLVVFGEVDKYEAMGANAFGCMPDDDADQVGWVYLHSVVGVEVAREVARTVDQHKNKIGAHYEITITNGQCGYRNLVR